MAELAAEHECGETTIWRALAKISDPATDSQSATRELATGLHRPPEKKRAISSRTHAV